MKQRNLIFFWTLALISVFGIDRLEAQELNCKVQINTEKISGTDKSVYESLKNVVQEFMNAQQWSNLQLKNSEKIDCSMLFIMKSRDGDSYTCDLQIQSSRPVYGATYTTSLLNMREELTFDFQENQTLIYNETSIDNNLTATLAFWSYVILGMDFDSFSKLGGTPFFQKAQEITAIAQGSLGDNWKAQEDKNHWGWISALTDENQPTMRVLSYNYHRLGLDVMYEKADEGRTQITMALAALKVAKQAKPHSPLLSNFMDTKADELINVYSKADFQEKQAVFELLSDVYPASTERLQGIKTKK
ncbi:MAG: DUF4835 family protein [Bacteroidales bacterium]|nr:DUF4835 family protein [Bacteroidales bacterium]